MKKSSVKVCVRTRPTQNFAQDNIAIDEEHNTIMIDTAQNEEPVAGMLNNKTSSFKFRFDHVFHNASQSQVYDLYARDTVQGVVDGINGAVMSYGQTGSGKTFTMMGDAQSYEHRGVAPRAISQLFNEINSRIELEFRVSCTYMEIYNEKIFDLLSDLTNPDQAQDFTIVEEKDGRGVFVRGLAEVEIKDENECLSLLFSGGLSRTIATHKLNKRSNRSHSLFTIYLQQRQRSGVSERVVHSKLHLVDLAGSERLKKTMDNMDGEAGSEVTRKESMAINRSLTYLEQCVVALSRKGQTHIPYRQSKLTNVLKDCLGANCNTVMLACMWGEASHLEETVSTLRLASRMMRVQNETVSVETVDPSALIKKQEKIIRALKQELLMHDALVERTGVTYEPYTPEQQESISQMLERFLAAPQLDEEDVLNITNYRQMLEICKQFKKKILNARGETRAAQELSYAPMSASGRARTAEPSEPNVDYAADSKIATYDRTAPMVGTTVGAGGFALGVSGSDSRPLNGIEGASRYTPQRGGPAGSKYSPPSSPTAKFGFSPQTSPARREFMDSGGKNMALFESFTKNEGGELFREFTLCKTALKDERTKGKELGAAVNSAKLIIDRLQHDIDLRKSSRLEFLRASAKASSKDELVDEEEYRLAKEIKDAKQAYRNCFDQMTKHRKAAMSAQVRAEELKIELGRAFNHWDTGPLSPTGGLGGMRSPGTGGEEEHDLDQLDDQEAFDKLEIERVLASDPESLAFFHAQKTRRANITQQGGNLKRIQKNKRFN